MHCAWIKIDVHRVTLRLWRTEGQWLSDFELRQWLKGHGYNWAGGNWYTCDGQPNGLEKDEILQTQTRVTENGVTFVDDGPATDGEQPRTQK